MSGHHAAVRVLACFTSLSPKRGGIASVNRNVVLALRETRLEGRVVDARAIVLHDEPLPRLHNETDVPRPNCPEVYCRSSRWRFVYSYLRLGLGWRPNLVFVDHLHLAVVPYLLRRVVRVPFVLFCHGIEFDPPLSRLRQAAFRGALVRLSNSHFTAKRLMNRFPGTIVTPCELGIEETAHATTGVPSLAVPDSFGQRQLVGEHCVLVVSRIVAAERYKGHDQLISIMPEILRNVPSAQLLNVGEGDDRGRLTELAKARGVGHAVLFTGFAPPELLARLFARCRLFAMPSRGEGFGLAYLEAMRYGKPCVASRVDGGSEVVVDGVTGLHVDPADLVGLREAVVRLLRDDGLTATLGQAGRDRLNRHYRFTHFRERLLEQLEAALDLSSDGAAAVEDGEISEPTQT